MKKTFFLLWMMILLLVCVPALAQDWGSFVVEDEEEDAAPDPRQQARAMMRKMTDEEKIYQLFYVTLEDLTGEAHTSEMPSENVFLQYPVGGVMIFGQNIVSSDQLARLTEDMVAQAQKARLYPLFIGVDEEGGAVSRVANKLGLPLAPSPLEIGASGDTRQAHDAGLFIAAYLKPFHINMTFAPSADTMIDQEAPGAQSYGTDPALVSRMANAMAEGLREGGILPCYTHFPGHGPMEGTTLGTMSIRRTIEEMQSSEWIPFQTAVQNGAEMILVSHGFLRAVGDTIPASTSSQAINGMLRTLLSYDGVVVTDSLRMNAVTAHYKKGQESVAALKAGADILLLPPDLPAAVSAIQKALATGDLTMARIDESVERILAVKIRMSMIQDE